MNTYETTVGHVAGECPIHVSYRMRVYLQGDAVIDIFTKTRREADRRLAQLRPVLDVRGAELCEMASGFLRCVAPFQSVRMTGRATVGPGIEAPIVIEVKRPRSLCESTSPSRA